MSTRPHELNKIISDLRQIIVGKVAMPPDQIEQITLFLFLKQLSKKHDELVRIGSKELIFTGNWERYHFDVLVRHSGEELVKECREAVESLYKNPHIDPTVRKVFERSYLKILDPKVLSSFLQYLNEKFSDGLDLGDFYESLLPILGTQNELGQFRTPRHIIDFIVRVIDPNIGERIADPACGTAGFLVASFNYLKEKYTKEGRLTLNPEQTKQLYNDTIYGWDMEPLMVKFSLANLYLHGLKVPNVSENDTLLNENLWQHTFDIIMANPPFITPKGGARRHSRFAIKSNKTEVLFCEWMVHHLNYNGRMGVIVPEGIIFDSSRGHHSVRQLFLDSGLWCVVSLPGQVFQPYSGVKTSIVFLDKTLTPENILFYEIENHGYSLNTNPVPIEKNDLPEALSLIKRYRLALQEKNDTIYNEQKYYTITKERVLENDDKSLSGRLYKEKKTDSPVSVWETIELGKLTKTFADGNWIESKDQSDCGIRLIQTGNVGVGEYKDKDGKARYISEETFKRLGCTEIYPGDVLISRLPDPVGRACIIPKLETRMITAVDCTIVRFDETKILQKYFLYLSKSESYFNELSKYLTGASRQRISRLNLAKIRIPLPPLDIQEQIVKELESYQKIIDGAKLVVDGWKPSFNIDPSWEIKKLGDISERITKGTTPTTMGFHYQDTGINFVKIESIDDNGYFLKEKFAHISEDCNNMLKRSQLKNGDVLFSIAGALGRVALVKQEILPANTNQALAIISPKTCLKSDYLEQVLRSSEIFNKLDDLKVGVAQYNISLSQVADFDIPLPPLEVQMKIVENIIEERKIVEANKHMINLFEKRVEAKVKSIWEG